MGELGNVATTPKACSREEIVAISLLSAYDEINLNKGGAMEVIHKLELTLEAQYKKVPHLPVGVRKWLAENAWWLVLIGVIVGIFAILSILSLLGLAMLGLSIGGALLGAGIGAAVGATLGGILLVTALISLALYIAETVLMGMAIMPLKDMKKRGWDLLFVVAVLNAVSIVVVGVLTFDLLGLVWSLLWIALSVYFLYEVRDYFLVKKAVPKKKPVEAEAKLEV